MEEVSFLDCTLRDGAHVNNGNFGEEHIKHIIKGLTEASVDIIEIGFLRQVQYAADVTSFPRIEDACNLLSDIPHNENIQYALMARADQYDIAGLSECDGRIGLIRVAFYYDYLKEAIAFAKEVSARGYRFTLNLINTPGNSMRELLAAVDLANKIMPYALTIVDTYGVLDLKSLLMIVKEYDENLDSAIRIGFHAHENMALAFSLAQGFIETMISRRCIIVDGSLMGIGRAPGNLCTELISDYLNGLGKSIRLESILDLIENDITPIKASHKWGYSPEFFLSAKYKVHRSYAEYLSDQKVGLKDIAFLLSRIGPVHGAKFNKGYIDMLLSELRTEERTR